MTLDDGATGRWLVQTAASTYLLDMDARTVLRTPGKLSEWPAAELRLDAQAIPLLRVLAGPLEGWPMILMLDVRRDGVQTVRTTTPVLSVFPEGVMS